MLSGHSQKAAEPGSEPGPCTALASVTRPCRWAPPLPQGSKRPRRAGGQVGRAQPGPALGDAAPPATRCCPPVRPTPRGASSAPPLRRGPTCPAGDPGGSLRRGEWQRKSQLTALLLGATWEGTRGLPWAPTWAQVGGVKRTWPLIRPECPWPLLRRPCPPFPPPWNAAMPMPLLGVRGPLGTVFTKTHWCPAHAVGECQPVPARRVLLGQGRRSASDSAPRAQGHQGPAAGSPGDDEPCGGAGPGPRPSWPLTAGSLGCPLADVEGGAARRRACSSSRTVARRPPSDPLCREREVVSLQPPPSPHVEGASLMLPARDLPSRDWAQARPGPLLRQRPSVSGVQG